MNKVQIKILDSRIEKEFGLPQYATEHSAGLDLYACIDEKITLHPGATEKISTGLAVYLGDPNFAGLILPRSGLGHKHGIVLGNLVGLLDADYQGPLYISCWNRSDTAYTISPGERIAQLVIIPIYQVDLEIVSEFHVTTRGEGGFGHTGK